MDWIHLVFVGIAFGLGAAVPIGPINTEVARRTLRRGPLHGIVFGGGAVSVDAVFAVLACLGIGVHLAENPAMRIAFGVGGFLLMLTLAMLTLRGAVRAWRHRGAVRRNEIESSPTALTSLPDDRGPLQYQPKLRKNAAEVADVGSIWGGYLTGLLMTAINPYTLAFWFVALPAGPGSLLEKAHRDIPALVIGVVVGTFGWVLVFSLLLGYLKKFSHDSWIIIADVIGGTMLLIFAALALASLFR